MKKRSPFFNSINASERAAVNKIASLVDSGHFDFSEEMLLGLFAWFPISGCLAFESAKFYLKIGGDGTGLLPPASFFKNQKRLGEESAFWCNFSLYWYFMMTTVLDIREAYLNYQARKKLGVPYTRTELIKISIKFVPALFLALSTGAVSGLIAGKDSQQPWLNQAIVIGVTTLLSFVGSVTEINVISSGISLLKNLCYKTKKNVENYATQQIKSYIHENLTELKRRQSDDIFWVSNPRASDMVEHLLAESHITTPLLSKTKNKKNSFTLKNMAYAVIWLGMQYCNLIGLLGWYIDTVGNMDDLFKVGEFSTSAWLIGTIFFSTFAFLALQLVQTTMDETLELGKSIIEEAKHVKEHPSVMKHKDFWKAVPINIFASVLTLGSYFMSYVSSNSSLGLNAKYGFNQPWNIYPTCISTTVFNGFAFLLVLIGAAVSMKKYVVDLKGKRNSINKCETMHRFIQYNPSIIEKISEVTTVGMGFMH